MAGIAGPRGGASHSRLRRVADPYPSRMGEALWQTRLRWRLRGAMLWPAFVVAVVVRGHPARPAAGVRRRRPGAVRRRAAGRLPEPRASWRWPRRWPGAGCAAAGPGMPAVIATDRAGTVLLVAARAPLVAVLGLLHHSSVRAAREDLNAQAASARRFFVSQAPREFQANVDHLDTVKQGEDLYRTCVAGARPRPRVLRLRQHRPVAAGRHARSRPAAQRGGGAVGAVGGWSSVRVAFAALLALTASPRGSGPEAARPRAVVLGG